MGIGDYAIISSMLLAVMLLAQDTWTKIETTFDKRETGGIVTFYPVRVASVKLGAAVPKDKLEVFGERGLVPIASADGGIITFKEPAAIAEIQIHAPIKSVDVFIPKNAERAKPPKDDQLKALGEFKITYYWVLFQEEFSGPENTPILRADGKALAKAPAEFVKQLHVEGTGKLKDGRIVNTTGNQRYRVVEAPYGIGVDNLHLIPFKSVAVDKTVIPIGSKIFIKELAGTKLPDGSIHDGVLYAHDVGSGVEGKHIDVFVARKKSMSALSLPERVKVFGVKE